MNELLELYDDEYGNEDPPVPNGPNLERSTSSLPRLLLAHATTPAQRRYMKTAQTLSVLVKVPAADWVSPMHTHLRHNWSNAEVISKSERDRSPSHIEATLSTFTSSTTGGRRLAAVSHDPHRCLPAAVIASADVVLEIGKVPNTVIRRAIQAATGKRVPALPASIAAGLGFLEIAGAIRIGSTPRQCIKRRVAARRSRSTGSIVENAPLIEDLHGYGPAKEWALNLLTDLELWRAGELKFEDIERNVVLASAPGLGKTTFAKSLAHSTGLPLIATGVGEWFANGPGHLDSVIKEVDRVFAAAMAAAPAILFIDELDAIPDRRSLDSRNRDWWLPVITHILTKLDGATSGDVGKLIVMGATNFIEHIDPALLRPGRLSKVIEIGLPSVPDLAGIYRQHLGGDLADADLRMIAELSRGSTGAEVMGFVKAARRAARQKNRRMKLDDLLEIVAPSESRSDQDVWRVAIHEASHAVVGHLQGDSIEAISIIRRGLSGGHTIRKFDASTMLSKSDIENHVRMALAGRCGERVFFQHACAGSGGYEGSDLAEASRLIAMMHTSLGLGENLVFRGDADTALQILKLDKVLRDRVEADLRVLETQTSAAIEKNRSLIERVARALVEHRYLNRDRFLQIVEEGSRNPTPGLEHPHGKPHG